MGGDKKISELVSYNTPQNNDILPIVDVTTSESKKITWFDLKSNLVVNTLSPLNGGGNLSQNRTIKISGSSADRIIYTTGVDTWGETILTAFGRSLIDDADAQTARATLDATDKHVQINTQTANYTLVLSDDGKLIQIDSATLVNLTVPPNSSVAFPIGTKILFQQVGAGQVTLVAGTGVTLRSAVGLKTNSQYSIGGLIKTGTDTWEVLGDLTT